MDVSIIIVSYNTRDLLKECLHSVIKHTIGLEYEVIVVDNMSMDGSAAMIQQDFPQIKLIKNTENIGFARANNIGIRESSSKYVFLLNSDTSLLNNAIKVLFEYMENDDHKNVFCCGGNLIAKNGNKAISCGNLPSVLGVLFNLLRLDILMPKYYEMRLSTGLICKNGSPYCVEYVSGADMFIRRSCLDECDFFDEDFFLYFEETELSFRMRKYGYRSMIIPQVNIIHLYGKSSPNHDFKRIERFEKSRILYFEKCHGVVTAYILRNLCRLGYLLRFLVAFHKVDLKKFLLYCRL